MDPHLQLKKSVGMESIIFLLGIGMFFVVFSLKMGMINMINTVMNTSYDILISTVFYITAIAVIMGALSELLSEFGVISVANRVLSPLAKPVYGMPGAAVMGIFSTYLSDNPAILTLSESNNYRCYFQKYQIPALTNLGTSFGMGLIVTAFIISIPLTGGESMVGAAVIGNLGAVAGSIVSTRLMLRHTARYYGEKGKERASEGQEQEFDVMAFRKIRQGNLFSRFLEAMLDGGKSGVKMGVSIIPGVLIICTLVLMFTNGASADGTYTGAAYEGIGLLPVLGEKLQFIFRLLFGFSSPECIAVPITSLGAAGAAISLIPNLVSNNLANGNDVAVFTAMCMCWSGYLSTHIAMMESLGCRKLAGKAITSHTIGGLTAGIAAHLLYLAWSMIR